MKAISILLIVLGEAIAIYAEMFIARRYEASGIRALWPAFLFITVAGILLVLGYLYGYRAFKNIWIVAVISIGAILVIEPLLAWSMFHEIPTKGSVMGLILGFAGIASALFIK